jgi:tetratricopeptide (TPR) repeat protein
VRTRNVEFLCGWKEIANYLENWANLAKNLYFTQNRPAGGFPDAHTHNTMAASSFFLRWDVQTAEKESARAIALNPRDAEAHYVRCWILFALRRADEALREERLSMEIDPRLHPSALGEALLLARQYDAGIAELRARAEVQPEDQDVHEALSNLYWQKKMYAESVRELAKTYVPKSEAELQDAFRRGGSQGAAEWRLAYTKKLQAQMYVSPFELAHAAARAGHKEEALGYLEQSCQEHVPWLVLIVSEPDLDFVRSEPRYQAITKKLGLSSAM